MWTVGLQFSPTNSYILLRINAHCMGERHMLFFSAYQNRLELRHISKKFIDLDKILLFVHCGGQLSKWRKSLSFLNLNVKEIF